jgi:hypothetical protein
MDWLGTSYSNWKLMARKWEGEASSEPHAIGGLRLGRSLALPFWFFCMSLMNWLLPKSTGNQHLKYTCKGAFELRPVP